MAAGHAPCRGAGQRLGLGKSQRRGNPDVCFTRTRRAVHTCPRAAAGTAELGLAVGACSLPHPEKLATGGEDAHFVSSDGLALGVADGVGGWRESGVDPGEYSRTLMSTARAFLEGAADSRGALASTRDWEEHARAALAAAHAKTRLPGSSTACVLLVNPERNWLSAANLGDSGFVVVRNGTVLFQTPALQHFFDCPYQFGAYPEYVEATDHASDAQTFTLNILAGDIIVMGSDGLFDNCPLDEMLPLLPDRDTDVAAAAERLAALAQTHAGDPEFRSPYVVQAMDQGMDLPWWEKVINTRIKDGQLRIGGLSGGKLDDITVLVARVSEQGAEPEQPVVAAASEPPAAPSAPDAASEGSQRGPQGLSEPAAESPAAPIVPPEAGALA